MKKLYASFVFCLVASSAFAQLITVNGAGPAPTVSGNVYTLTRPDIYYGGQANAVWEQTQISLANPFTVCARLYFGTFSETNPDPNNPNGVSLSGLPFNTGADGIAFVLAPQPYVGFSGEEIGYGTRDITNPGGGFPYTPNVSFAVEFDTWRNIAGSGAMDLNDPIQDHMAFMRNGLTAHTGINAVTPVVNLGDIENGAWYNVSITWNPATGMTVDFNGITMSTSAADVIGALGGNPAAMVNWGWTAATGMGTNEQRLELVNCAPSCNLTVSAGLAAIGCGPANVLYLGYGPQSIMANANITAGTTYQWYRNGVAINGATAASYTPTMPGTYWVVATNGQCVASTEGAATQVTVIDIRCGKPNQNKVYVCHKPNGNGNGINGTNGGPNSLCVDASAVPAHLAHGDCLGMCGQLPAARMASGVVEADEHPALEPIVYPNPTRGNFVLKLPKADQPATEIHIVNSRGEIVERRLITGNQPQLNLDLKKHGTGMFLIRIISGDQVQTQKILVRE